jgi:hypothetical protein
MVTTTVVATVGTATAKLGYVHHRAIESADSWKEDYKIRAQGHGPPSIP